MDPKAREAMVRFVKARIKETYQMHREAGGIDKEMTEVFDTIEQDQLSDVDKASDEELEKLFREAA